MPLVVNASIPLNDCLSTAPIFSVFKLLTDIDGMLSEFEDGKHLTVRC